MSSGLVVLDGSLGRGVRGEGSGWGGGVSRARRVGVWSGLGGR